MRTAGVARGFPFLLAFAWLLLSAWMLGRTGPAPVLHATPEVSACPTPVEIRGQGILCAPSRGGPSSLGPGPGPGPGPGDALSWEMDRDREILGPPARMAPARLLLTGVRIDLNHASLDELVALPGIGPALAGAIVAARPFAAVPDLGRVPGIGRRRVAALAPLVTVR